METQVPVILPPHKRDQAASRARGMRKISEAMEGSTEGDGTMSFTMKRAAKQVALSELSQRILGLRELLNANGLTPQVFGNLGIHALIYSDDREMTEKLLKSGHFMILDEGKCCIVAQLER